jgi:hypothetical protein
MIKCVIGYDIAEGMTSAEYEEWLWNIHVPELLANPYLEKVVYNTVIRPVTKTSTNTVNIETTIPLYRVSELHFKDMDAYEKYLDWFVEHPIPEGTGPAGRTDFKFYVLCGVKEATRD